jgi:hypothetical protein
MGDASGAKREIKSARLRLFRLTVDQKTLENSENCFSPVQTSGGYFGLAVEVEIFFAGLKNYSLFLRW